MHRIILLSLLLSGLHPSSSGVTEFSPDQIFDRNSSRNINGSSIRKLNARHGKDSVSIAFIGNPQWLYDKVELFVEKIIERITIQMRG